MSTFVWRVSGCGSICLFLLLRGEMHTSNRLVGLASVEVVLLGKLIFGERKVDAKCRVCRYYVVRYVSV